MFFRAIISKYYKEFTNKIIVDKNVSLENKVLFILFILSVQRSFFKKKKKKMNCFTPGSYNVGQISGFILVCSLFV